MVCVQDVIVKKRLVVQLKYGKRKEMSYSSLHFLCSKDEVEMDDPKSNLRKKSKRRIVDY